MNTASNSNLVGMALGYVVYYAFQKKEVILDPGATEEGYKRNPGESLEKAVSAKDRF